MCKTYIPFTSLPLFIVISTLPSHPVQHSRTSEAKLALQKITEGLIEKVNELAALPLNTAAVVTPKKGRKSGTKEVTRDTEYAFGLALPHLRALSMKFITVDVIELHHSEPFLAAVLNAGSARDCHP